MCNGVPHRRLLHIGGNNAHFPEPGRHFGQSGYARTVYTIIVSYQYPHTATAYFSCQRQYGMILIAEFVKEQMPRARLIFNDKAGEGKYSLKELVSLLEGKGYAISCTH